MVDERGAPPDPQTPARRRDRRWRTALLALVGLSLFVRVWAPGPVTETYDEFRWLGRTDQFVQALRTGDLDHTSPAAGDEVTTMPGVTVMYAGAAGRLAAKAAAEVGVIGDVDGPSVRSAAVLRAGRAMVASACSVALGVLVWAAARVVGRRAALIAGVLLATEPFLAGHAGLLHTDALVTMLSALSIAAAMAAVWGRRPRDRVAWPMVALSAVAGGLALLTKLNTLPVLLPGLALIGLLELVRRLRRRGPAALRELLLAAVGWTAGAALVVVGLWPALWTSPVTQLDRMVVSSRLASVVEPTPAWAPVAEQGWFIPINLLVRMTPWMLLGLVAGATWSAVAMVRRRWGARWPMRQTVAVLVLAPVPYLAVLAREPRVFDRYLLPLWPFVALVVGVWVSAAVDALGVDRRLVRAGAGIGTVALAAAALAWAPYGTAYADPLLRGRQTEALIALGWGEGVEQLGRTIAEREAGRCGTVLIAVRYPLQIALPCGQLVPSPGSGPSPQLDYVIIEVRHRQRRTLPGFDAAARRGTLIQRVVIGGVSYAELYQLR